MSGCTIVATVVHPGDTRSGPRPVAGLVAWGVAGTTLLLTAASLALSHLNGNGVGVAGFSVAFLGFAVVGGILGSRVPENRLSWCLLGVPLCIGLYAFAEQYATYALVTRPGSLPGGSAVAWAGVSLWVPGAMLTLVFIPLIFPDGRPPSPRWSLVGWLAFAIAVAITASSQVVAWPQRGPALLQEESWTEPIATLLSVLFLSLLGCGFAALGSLVTRYLRAGRFERLQLRWFAAAVTFMLAAFAVGQLTPAGTTVDFVIYPLAVSAVPLAVGIAVLRYRLYEIDRIISRTVSYGLLTLALAGVYVGGVVGLGGIVRATTGGGGGDLVVAISTLAVAALFQPLRRRVQALVDRRFNRARYDAQRTVEVFTQRLRDELDLDALTSETTRVVATTMRPDSLSLWLQTPASSP